jgi:hypothetical protein
MFGSYTYEGNATIGGARQPGSSRASTLVSLSGLWPFSERVRAQASASVNPPISGLGANTPAVVGFSVTAVQTW